MKEILLRNRTIRRTVVGTVGGIAVIAGLSGMVYAEFDSLHSPAKIEKRVGQLVPGYNPDYNPKQLEVARQVIVDFSKQTEGLAMEGAKTIEVPKKVTEAATFIKEDQEKGTYDEGRKLYVRMHRNNFHKNFGLVLGSSVLGFIGGFVLMANIYSKPKDR